MLFFRLADAEILRKPDYFGKFGKIHKVVINHSTQYAGSQLQVSWILSNLCMNNVSSESCTGAKCKRVRHLLQVRRRSSGNSGRQQHIHWYVSSELCLYRILNNLVILRWPHSEGITWYYKVLFALHEKSELSQE